MRTLLSKKHFSILRETGSTIPPVSFVSIKNAILGKTYDLNLVFVSRKRGKELHRKFKQENTILNIFSFPYSNTSGEIIMTLSAVRADARKFNTTYHQHLAFLFVHGCVHLLGFDHSSAMEKKESVYLKKFNIHNPYI